MSRSPTLVALGQRFAGDDAVGLAVADRLRAAGVLVVEARDAADLVEALGAGGEVILVDALRGPGAPGSVRVIAPEDVDRDGAAAISSHGLDVPGAVALAAALHPGAPPPRLCIVGVVVGAVERFSPGLSPPVAAAVERAAEAVLELCGSPAKDRCYRV